MKEKLNLENLEVESFVTLNEEMKRKLYGGEDECQDENSTDGTSD